jgi:hypothetical protein
VIAWTGFRDVVIRGGLTIPARATIMRLADGRLVLHSPIGLDDATVSEIRALGDVRFLIAPSCLHWMFVKASKERFPKARLFAAPNLKKKLGSFSFEPLPEKGELDGAEGLRVERIQGAPKLQEHVFLHESSRSLVLTDLIFNVHACRSLGMRMLFWIGGTWKKTGQSLEWRLLVKDRAAAAKSAIDVLSWDFERIVVAHGTVVVDDARERARQALRWMTSGAPKLLTSGSGTGSGSSPGSAAA